MEGEYLKRGRHPRTDQIDEIQFMTLRLTIMINTKRSRLNELHHVLFQT